MITDVGVENLAAAIIENTLKDYEAAYSQQLYLEGQRGRREELENAREEVERLEKWFHSSWYEMLTNLDPDYLIKGVRERVRRKRHI